MTVAPLTATVLGAVSEEHSGVASGVNNAIARIAGLLAIAALGAVVASQFNSNLDKQLSGKRLSPAATAAVHRARARPLSDDEAKSLRGPDQVVVKRALDSASQKSFHVGIGVAAALVFLGGVISLAGIENPRRQVRAEECPGGAICGASRDAADATRRAPAEPEPARA
jgi:hypothetical protein